MKSMRFRHSCSTQVQVLGIHNITTVFYVIVINQLRACLDMEEPKITVRRRDVPQGNDAESANDVQPSAENAVENRSPTNGGTIDNGAETNQQQQPPPQESPWSVVKTIAFRLAIFWFIMNLFRGNKTPTTSGPPGTVTGPAVNLFRNGDPFELLVYCNEDPYMEDFERKGQLLWKETGILYGEWYDGPNKDGSREANLQIEASKNVQNNGSLYLHVFMVKQGFSPDPKSRYYERTAVVNQTKLLTVYRKQRLHKTKNLLTGESDAKPELLKANETHKPKIISYWHPNLTISVLYDQTPWTLGSIPQPIDQYVVFDNFTNSYYPVLYLNNYWNYASDYMPVNESTKTLELNLVYSPISLFKWQMYLSQQMRSQWNSFLGDSQEYSDEEQDMLKRTLQETNPYLLGLTIVVSLVHSVFEFLAFKNDIQFWRSRKSLEGLSVRSVFFNVFQSVIVVLFVLDNDTNTVVIISCFVGLVIELWKITKVVDIKLDRENPVGPFPRIKFQDKSTYTESETRKYDTLAFKYLSWILFPLLGCYAVYSLIYQEHKGWYSWVLSMLYGFLLTFGFIMMTPQLFINYKLKSVAHLPWRMLTYKALNTFIDDIFAFVIKMPTLYRIGCLRDDVIFFIYLYQRWIYPIDYKRINEFGVSGDGSTQPDAKEASSSDTRDSDAAPLDKCPVTANGNVNEQSGSKKDN